MIKQFIGIAFFRFILYDIHMKTIEDMYITSKQDMLEAVQELGILPFFKNSVPGFSIEERCSPEVYFSSSEGVWEWKGPVMVQTGCAYGKFFEGKAVFVSSRWINDLANYKRDGYDFDARVDEGLSSYDQQYLYNLIDKYPSVLSKQLKAEGGYIKPKKNSSIQWEPRKGFDTQMTKLQKLGYITTTDFEYETDKNGNFYGWGIARYATFEHAFGKKFIHHVYDRTPEESFQRLFNHLKKILPEVQENEIEYFLKMG